MELIEKAAKSRSSLFDPVHATHQNYINVARAGALYMASNAGLFFRNTGPADNAVEKGY